MQVGDFLSVRKASRACERHPSGLGHFDVALYMRTGRELERKAAGRRDGPACVLDLGTYFGHSALTFVLGAAQVSRRPGIRVLSLDIFEEPEWYREQPDIAAFIRTHGSADRDAVARSLELTCKKEGLPAECITLWKQDVNLVTAEELKGFAPGGFDAVAIDCGKTPEAMNSIVKLVCDPAVTRPGAVVCFQDFHDWHAPWNVVAFWKLLRLGYLRIRSIEPGIAPVAEIVKHGNPGEVCNRIEHREPDWCSIHTDRENEFAAYDGMSQLLDRLNQPAKRLRVQCLQVGALLRHGEVSEAEALLDRLDAEWPRWLRDGSLLEAYRRFAHVKTGKKDLSLRLRTTYSQRRRTAAARWLQRAHLYSEYFRSPVAVGEVQLRARREGGRVQPASVSRQGFEDS